MLPQQFADKSIGTLLEMLDQAAFQRGSAAMQHIGYREPGHQPIVQDCNCSTALAYLAAFATSEQLTRYIRRVSIDSRLEKGTGVTNG